MVQRCRGLSITCSGYRQASWEENEAVIELELEPKSNLNLWLDVNSTAA